MIALLIFTVLIHSTTSLTILSHDVMALLLKYGYLQIENKDQLKNVTFQRELIEDGRFNDAIVKFQSFNNLNITGNLNDDVIKLLTSPRCGNPDIVNRNKILSDDNLKISLIKNFDNCNSNYSKGISSHEAMVLLLKFGYLQIENKDQLKNVTFQRELIEDGRFSDAIVKFQAFHGLNKSGKLNEETKKLIKFIKCFYLEGLSNLELIENYIHKHDKWHKSTLSWKILKYYTRTITKEEIHYTIAKAFRIWSNYTNLNFYELRDPSQVADIEITFNKLYKINKNEKILGRARTAYLNPNYFYITEQKKFERISDGILYRAKRPILYKNMTIHADIEFDTIVDWKFEKTGDFNFLFVALHEIGHALGLKHSKAKYTIMEGNYPHKLKKYDVTLFPDDIAGIQALYGAPPPGKVLPPLPKHPHKRTGTNFCRTSVDAIIKVDNQFWIFKNTKLMKTRMTEEPLNKFSFIQSETPINWFNNFPVNINQIDAGVQRSDGNIYLFSGDKFWIISRQMYIVRCTPRCGLPLTKLGLPGHIKKIDAAFQWEKNQYIYIFAGDNYWKINENSSKYGRISKGYPRSILGNWKGVPKKVDAAFTGLSGKTYFIKGKSYYSFNNSNMRVDGNLKSLHLPAKFCDNV